MRYGQRPYKACSVYYFCLFKFYVATIFILRAGMEARPYLVYLLFIHYLLSNYFIWRCDQRRYRLCAFLLFLLSRRGR